MFYIEKNSWEENKQQRSWSWLTKEMQNTIQEIHQPVPVLLKCSQYSVILQHFYIKDLPGSYCLLKETTEICRAAHVGDGGVIQLLLPLIYYLICLLNLSISSISASWIFCGANYLYKSKWTFSNSSIVTKITTQLLDWSLLTNASLSHNSRTKTRRCQMFP